LYLINGNMLPLQNITEYNAYMKPGDVDNNTEKEESSSDEKQEVLELDKPDRHRVGTG
jgi:hypothetical protein